MLSPRMAKRNKVVNSPVCAEMEFIMGNSPNKNKKSRKGCDRRRGKGLEFKEMVNVMNLMEVPIE